MLQTGQLGQVQHMLDRAVRTGATYSTEVSIIKESFFLIIAPIFRATIFYFFEIYSIGT